MKTKTNVSESRFLNSTSESVLCGHLAAQKSCGLDDQLIHLHDGYASSVMNAGEQYQCIEIRGVREVGEGDNVECEEDYSNPQFFSCYARSVSGPASCIGDFGYLIWARDYADQIAAERGGLPVVCLVG